jgi:acetoin utilization protein AcuB
MLAGELNKDLIPHLKLEDTVAKALQLMADYKVSHLPVATEDKYLGLISEEDLLDAESNKLPISTFQNDLLHVSIRTVEHFTLAVNIISENQTNIVPVVNEAQQLVGTITAQSLLEAFGTFTGAQEPGGIIVLEMERSQFSISEISRIVESNDATIYHLNTTVMPVTGFLNVTLQINKRELAVIVAAFKRYEYDVIYYFGDEKFESQIDTNYQNLLNYLKI